MTTLWKTLAWLPVLVLAAPYLELVLASIPSVRREHLHTHLAQHFIFWGMHANNSHVQYLLLISPATTFPELRPLIYFLSKKFFFPLHFSVFVGGRSPQRLVYCFHDCYHCMNVRRDSLKSRYGGHGFLYSFMAAMLATFASRIVCAVWSMKVPTLASEYLLTQRVLDACLCWLLVNLTPTRTVSSVYGNGRYSAMARGALFAGEGLNKFDSLTRGVLRSHPKRTLERLMLVASSGAASTLSRALTDRYVIGDKPSWLMNVVSATAIELRRYLALVTVLFVAHGESVRRVVEYFHCDADEDDITTTGGVGMLMKQLQHKTGACVAPGDHSRVEELARQSVLLLTLTYILSVYLGKSAKPVAFKAKPKAKKVFAAEAKKAIASGNQEGKEKRKTKAE